MSKLIMLISLLLRKTLAACDASSAIARASTPKFPRDIRGKDIQYRLNSKDDDFLTVKLAFEFLDDGASMEQGMLDGSFVNATLEFEGQINRYLKLSETTFDLCSHVVEGSCADLKAGGQLKLEMEQPVPGGYGLYSVDYRAVLSDGRELWCAEVDFGQGTPVAYVWAVVTFAIAALASLQLGGVFPYICLPLITGFLFVGILVGPSLTGMVQDYAAALVGTYINKTCLAYISFAAGAEIYIPDFRGKTRPLVLQITSVLLFTMVLVTPPVWAMGEAGKVDWMELVPIDGTCRIGQALLLAAVMVARSPSAAIAILKDPSINVTPGGRAHSFTRTMLGVTVLSDVAVIVTFSVVSTVTGTLCQGDAGIQAEEGAETKLDFIAFLLILLNLALSFVLGVVVGGVLLLVLGTPVLAHHELFRTYCSEVGAKGFAILVVGYLSFVGSEELSEALSSAAGRSIELEPLLVCMTGASLAGQGRKFSGFMGRHQSKGRRARKLGTVLHALGPFVFLPFYTLTGVELDLEAVLESIGLTFLIFFLRAIAIFAGSYAVGVATRMRREERSALWLTLVPQAGVTLGLASGVATRYPLWGRQFQVVVTSVVVLNELVGPIATRYAIILFMELDDDKHRKLLQKQSDVASTDTARSHDGPQIVTNPITVTTNRGGRGGSGTAAATALEGVDPALVVVHETGVDVGDGGTPRSRTSERSDFFDLNRRSISRLLSRPVWPMRKHGRWL